jgi:hypothetical protein
MDLIVFARKTRIEIEPGIYGISVWDKVVIDY